MTPDTPFGNPKRLSVLQAVAQGYCPIEHEDAEQEICTGNQKLMLNTKSLEIEVVIELKGTHSSGEHHHERLEMGYVQSRGRKPLQSCIFQQSSKS